MFHDMVQNLSHNRQGFDARLIVFHDIAFLMVGTARKSDAIISDR
jgi:hypothetical protein